MFGTQMPAMRYAERRRSLWAWLAAGHLAPGDATAQFNLLSLWKLIRTNPDSQIVDSYRGVDARSVSRNDSQKQSSR